MPRAHNGAVSIYYETIGEVDDPALLLVNGLGSQCISYPLAWCELFAAEGFRVIRFDNRDVGRSTHLGDDRPDGVAYTLSDMADDVVAVLDDLGLPSAHVMGLSMGGMIVQQLAIDHPDRLRSLTSVMSTTMDPDVGQPAADSLVLLTALPPVDRDGYVARALEQFHLWGSSEWQDDDHSAAIAGEAFDRSFDPEGQNRQLLAVLSGPSRTAALGAVTVPALVMHGDADRLCDISGGRRTAEAIPGARFEVIEGLGHDYPPAVWPRWVELVTAHARAADGAAAR